MAGAVLIGLVAAAHYGQGWDEHLVAIYGRESLQAYSAGERAFVYSNHWDVTGPTGPGYAMAVELLLPLVSLIHPQWIAPDVRHFLNFTTFIVACFFIYYLCRRISSRRASILTAAAFFTQPLLFGHAFINPKDIPFMTLFLGSVELGLRMVDSLGSPSVAEGRLSGGSGWFLGEGGRARLKGVIARLGRVRILLYTVAAIVLISAALELLLWNRLLLPTSLRVVEQAYHGRAIGPVNSAFRAMADHQAVVPAVDYMWKLARVYWSIRWVPALLILFAAAVLIDRGVLGWLSRTIRERRTILLILASFALGLAWSVRSVAPLAGLLVAISGVSKRGFRPVPLLALYAILAVVFGLTLRPYWHREPVSRIVNSLVVAADFPWGGQVLFEGSLQTIDSLPAGYHPGILLWQLTEPVLVLFAVGSVVWLYRSMRSGEYLMLGVISVLWLAVPVLAALLSGAGFYDNYRQLFFILPTVFVAASQGLDWILNRLRGTLPSALAALVLLIPGAAMIVHLHPYEYVYYNRLVGGVNGVYRSYELDYWCTSTREAIEHVGQVAEPGAKVGLTFPRQIIDAFARSDLSLDRWDVNLAQDFDFVVICARSNRDLNILPETAAVFAVDPFGVVLSVVKQPASDGG